MERSPEFSVHGRRERSALVVAPRGELDLVTVPKVRAVLQDHREGDLVLDLREVAFMDTSGVHLIFEQQRRAEADGFSFALVRGPDPLQQLFDIVGLTHRLTFVDEAP